MNPIFKAIDWNTIAEVWWYAGVTAVALHYTANIRSLFGYIVFGIVVISFFVQCITTKKTQQKRDMVMDMVKK
jgi:hypothetical protein